MGPRGTTPPHSGVCVCVCDGEIDWMSLCMYVGVKGVRRQIKRNAFLPELGNLQQKAKWNLLSLVIVSLLYIYDPPKNCKQFMYRHGV